MYELLHISDPVISDVNGKQIGAVSVAFFSIITLSGCTL
jgi:hypothetical protein